MIHIEGQGQSAEENPYMGSRKGVSNSALPVKIGCQDSKTDIEEPVEFVLLDLPYSVKVTGQEMNMIQLFKYL